MEQKAQFLIFLACKEQAYETIGSDLHKIHKQKEPSKEESVRNF